jgi:hypothetical protein
MTWTASWQLLFIPDFTWNGSRSMTLTTSVRAIKEAMELQVEACMKEENEVAAAWQVWYHHTGTFSQGKDILKAKRASLADETFEMLMFMRGNKHYVTIFLKFFQIVHSCIN